MDLEIDKSRLRKTGVVYGVLLGAVLSILSILSFYVMISTSTVVIISAAPFIFSVVLPLALVVILCFYFRKKIGGYWNLRQAATGIFIMFFTAFVIQFIVRDQLFAKVVEPNMVQKTQTAMNSAVSKFLTESKASPQEVKKKLEEINAPFKQQQDFSIGKQIQSIGITIIFLFVLAIVFAAFFKREGPVYAAHQAGS